MSQEAILRTTCDGCGAIGETPSSANEIVPDGWEQITFQHDHNRCQVRHLCHVCMARVAKIFQARKALELLNPPAVSSQMATMHQQQLKARGRGK